MHYDVLNEGTDAAAAPMPFAIGNHLSLRYPFVPAGAGAGFGDGLLRGSATRECGLDDAVGCLDGTHTPRPEVPPPRIPPTRARLALRASPRAAGVAATYWACGFCASRQNSNSKNLARAPLTT